MRSASCIKAICAYSLFISREPDLEELDDPEPEAPDPDLPPLFCPFPLISDILLSIKVLSSLKGCKCRDPHGLVNEVIKEVKN